jgi:clan AA aspartic protease
MIAGTVSASRKPLLHLRVRCPAGAEMAVDALMDTGFNGFLLLPMTVINALGLTRTTSGRATLGDDSVVSINFYAVEIAWGAGWQTVSAANLGSVPLVGMELLDGPEVTMKVRAGGAVEVRPLP